MIAVESLKENHNFIITICLLLSFSFCVGSIFHGTNVIMLFGNDSEITLVLGKISIDISFELVKEHESHWMTTDFNAEILENHSHC